MPDSTSRTPEQGDQVWSRIRHDFFRVGSSQLLVALVLCVTAMVVVTQVRGRGEDHSYATLRRADLVSMLDQLNSESRRMDTEIQQLEQTRSKLASGADARVVAEQEQTKRLQTLRVLAGTVAATGPGVRITITDPQQKVGPEVLLNAIEEMRDAGAEAIAINGSVRVVASSHFGRVDGQLSVDGVRIESPITIEAIGDPHSLDEGARFRGGLVQEVESDQIGGSASVLRVEQLKITALHHPQAPRWAKPA